MNIRQFKPGQIITRVRLAKNEYGQESIDEELAGINLMGEKLILKSVENGCIYLTSDLGDVKLLMYDLLGFDWSNGWDYYKEIEHPVKMTHRAWFYGGMAGFILSMFIVCAMDVSNLVFYSYMAVFAAALYSFAIYITKTEQ